MTYISCSSDLSCISDCTKKEGIILGILVQSDIVIDLILVKGHCDHGPVILPYISGSIQ